MPNATKKILLISSGQPSLNPRLVKEADALYGAGYDVTVVYAYWNDWGTALDKDLLSTKKWTAIRAGGSATEDKLSYLISRLIFKCAKTLNSRFNNRLFADTVIARSAYFLTIETKKHQADLYIGHNLGALPATIKAAKKHHKPCGFDAEDFHRNEMSDDSQNPDVELKSIVEDKYIPQVNYLTASSAPIAGAYHNLFPQSNPVVIKNVFPKGGINLADINLNENQPLKLLWFSQTIGFSRGLENLIEVLAAIPGKFQLHLLGECNPDFKKQIDAADINVSFYSPIQPDALPAFAAQFDIGLALEPGFSINNNLALSNKIFTYLQAGLAIVASDTIAQQSLLTEYPQIGKTFIRSNKQSLTDLLLYYDEHREELLAAKRAALTLANTRLNWEIESKKFLDLVAHTLAG